jgi:hypothetical protein
VTPAPPRSTHDPIDANEVAAFRKALAAGVARPVPRDPEGAIEKAPRNYTLLTGFEDTEMHDAKRSDLSTTQPGELR